MSGKPRILWVQDEYEGPMNGLVEYEGEQLWFSRQTNPTIISSTEVPTPYVNVESENVQDQRERCNNRLYTLFRLSPNDMKLIIQNHTQYCAETGAPLKHGDPIKIKRHPVIKRSESDLSKAVDPANKDTRPEVDISVKMNLMHNVSRFQHKIIPSELTGTVVTVIKEVEFDNYYIPRKMVVAD